MPPSNRYRCTTKNAFNFANQSAKHAGHFAGSAGKYASKAITGLGRWATTDHIGAASRFAKMPPMGFIDTMQMALVTLVAGILGALLSGFLMFLLIAYGIPALLMM